MKKFFVILVVLLLVGCAQTNDLNQELDAMLEKTASEPYNFIQNHHSLFYDYYLPSDTYALNRNENGAIFSVNHYEILMNLNTINILQAEDDEFYYDDGFFKTEYRIYHKVGVYDDYNLNPQQYCLDVYRIEEEHLVVLSTAVMNYYAYVFEQEVVDAAKHMLMLARNVTILKDDIIKAYSNENIVDYQKKQINLFETIVPKEGRLEDLVIEDLYKDEISEE